MPLYLVLVALGFLPVLCAAVPNFSDLPNHVARHHVLATFGQGGPIDRFFAVEWRLIGNLGVDLPSVLLARWLGAEQATRLVSAFILPLTIGGILALSRAAHGRIAASAFIALPLAMHQAFMWGFLNYSLSLALALLAAAWLAPRQRGIAATAFMAMGVFVAHIGGWAVLLVLAGGMESARLRHWRDIGGALRRTGPLLAPLVPILVWRSKGAGPAFSYQGHDLAWNKAMAFVHVLRGVSLPLDLALTAAVGLAGLWALCWAGGRRLDPRLVTAGILLLILALVTPTTVMGSWGADFRIVPAALIVLLLAIGPARTARRERTLVLAGLCLFGLRLGTVTWDWIRQSDVLSRRLAVLDDVPRGSILGSIWVDGDCHVPWRVDPDQKLAGFAVARRDAFSNTVFQVEGSDIMLIRDPHMRAVWRDSSARVLADCAAGKPDRAALDQRLRAMAADRFDRIWIQGLPASQIPVPTGYRPVRRMADGVLLGRR